MRRLSIAVALPLSLLAQEGQALFQKHCESCHRPGNDTRAPLVEAMRLLARDKIVATLESGSMKVQGAALSATEKTAVAAYLTSIEGGAKVSRGDCRSAPGPITDLAGWNGWGIDLANTRFQPAKAAGIDRKKAERLALKWVFGYEGANTAIAQPTVAAGRLFLGSMDGTVYSLDAKTGCRYWSFKAAATVRSAIVIEIVSGRAVLYFGDTKANMYALDARTGSEIWKTQVDTHAFGRVTGAAALYGGRLYVPVSSVEEVPAGNPKYACCTFRGSVVALDARSGKQLWKTYTIPDPPGPTRVNSAGTQMTGPAGAAIWATPTVDPKRKAIYVATGNAYSEPADTHSDAIMALDMESGSVRWSQQMTARDFWNFACVTPNRASCAEAPGQDLDFGSSPILKRVDGRDLLLAGQKSGVMHALDPEDKGKVVWQTRVGKGGALGGIEWGSAADDEKIYIAVSDYDGRAPEKGGGLFALRLRDGAKMWDTPAPKPACLGQRGCSAAQLAAVTLAGDVVFSGSMDGHIRAYGASDGKILWDFDTTHELETVNGVKGKGGSLSGGGAVAVNGMVYVNSGYGSLAGMPGNVLLAFSAE